MIIDVYGWSKTIARCPCTLPSTVETFGEKMFFLRGSREISLVPSLHRASTDAQMLCAFDYILGTAVFKR